VAWIGCGRLKDLSRDIRRAVNSRRQCRRPESLLERQLSEARGVAVSRLATLLKTISAHYDRLDSERRGIVRSMQLMSMRRRRSHARSAKRRHRIASILDNVKDAILTVDDAGTSNVQPR